CPRRSANGCCTPSNRRGAASRLARASTTTLRPSRIACCASTGPASASFPMTFRVRIDPVALRQIDKFAAYLRNYSEDFAIEQIERLDRIIALNLAESPLTWSYFPLTGA